MTTAITAKDAFVLYRASYGDVAALRGLSLNVESGESVAVLGPSGAGKSTFLSLCAGTSRPSSGEVCVLDIDVGSAGKAELARLRRRDIGVVKQHFHTALPAELTIEEIVGVPLRLLGGSRKSVADRSRRLLQLAGLHRRARAKPGELSGGEQQRVAICAALAKQPRLLLADEPTGELDSATSMVVLDLMLGLADDISATAVIVTHDDAVAERCARTIHIRDGRLAAEGITNPSLVLDGQGWLRIPEKIRTSAGLGDRVRALATWGVVELRTDTPQLHRVDNTSPRPNAAAKRIHAEVALDGVTKRFRTHDKDVVRGLSCAFAPELLHVLAGPSGSGKTTVLSLIAALDQPDSGAVWVAGARVDSLDRNEAAAYRRANVGYLSQHSTLVDYLSAEENVELALSLRGFTGHRARDRAQRWLTWVGLSGLATRRADRLSGGEQRRVALARALAAEPRILIADEPTAHLDQFSGRQIIRLLEQVARDSGTTVIAASHDPDLIAAADTQLNLADLPAQSTAPAARSQTRLADDGRTWPAQSDTAGEAES